MSLFWAQCACCHRHRDAGAQTHAKLQTVPLRRQTQALSSIISSISIFVFRYQPLYFLLADKPPRETTSDSSMQLAVVLHDGVRCCDGWHVSTKGLRLWKQIDAGNDCRHRHVKKSEIVARCRSGAVDPHARSHNSNKRAFERASAACKYHRPKSDIVPQEKHQEKISITLSVTTPLQHTT